MATENGLLDLPFLAIEDLSNDQFRFVVLTATGVRRPDSEAEVALGILQNAPGLGEAAAVRILGTSKLVAAAGLAVGLFVMPEFTSAADAGKGKTSVATPAYARAQVMTAAVAEDDLAQVLLTSPFPAATINSAIADPGNTGAIPVTGNGVCAMTSAGAETRTIAAPTFLGQQVSLIDDVHVGNIVVTTATTVNQTGNNTLTFGAAADACTLTAMKVAGALVWRISFNDGVALSTV